MTTKRIEDIVDASALPEPLREMYNIWNDLPKQGKVPLARSFSLEIVPVKVLPWSVLVSVIADSDDYIFKFWGTERVKLIGAEMTGKPLSQLSDTYMREGNKIEYDYVSKHGCAVVCQTPFTSPSGLSSVRSSIRLPLSDADGNITMIFSTIDPSSVTKYEYDYFGTSPRKFF